MSGYQHAPHTTTSWANVDACTKIGRIEIDSDTTSIVRMKLSGEHRANPNRRSEYVYVVTAGSVEFAMDNGEVVSADTGSVFRVDKGMGRTLRGEAELLIFNTPPWRAEDESPDA